jgi:DNA (cytosine-5)-methyltransferase 1
MAAYYNEFDPYAAEWLRALINADLIAPGDVDERSIADVRPDDLAPYTQVHLFAGLGGWSYALRLAGWPDDRPVWTGSAPCQPFSAAGQGKGQEDERHLWPEFARLIRDLNPSVVFGEQVASAIGKGWLDGVCTDLEGAGYACGAAVLPACAVNAPHRRDRLWFVANTTAPRSLPGAHCGIRGGEEGSRARDVEPERSGGDVANPGLSGWRKSAVRGSTSPRQEGADRTSEHREGYVANTTAPREGRRGICGPREGANSHDEWAPSQPPGHREGPLGHAHGGTSRQGDQDTRGCSDGSGARAQPRLGGTSMCPVGDPNLNRREAGSPTTTTTRHGSAAYATGWSDYEWLLGADGKARRVEPGVLLLAHGISGRVAIRRASQQTNSEEDEEHWYSRVGTLKGFGNAIVPQVGAAFITAYIDCS